MDNDTTTQDNEMLNASAIDGMLNESVITGVLEDFMGSETATQDNFTSYEGPGLPEGTRWSDDKNKTQISHAAFVEMLNASAIDGMLNESVINGVFEDFMGNETTTQDNEMINASAIDGMRNESVITGVIEDFTGKKTQPPKTEKIKRIKAKSGKRKT
jgi:hypothetical protein